MNSLIVATNNKNKLEEFKEIFKETGIRIYGLKEAGIEIEIEESGKSFRENAAIKAETIARLTKLPTIADDSGLCIEALNNEPGVYSARYAGDRTPYTLKNKIILDRMKGIKNRKARFVCAIAFVDTIHPTVIVEEECIGEVAMEASGERGFGYDPIFYLPSQNKTMADLSMEIKNKISHRAKALQTFFAWYQENQL